MTYGDLAVLVALHGMELTRSVSDRQYYEVSRRFYARLDPINVIDPGHLHSLIGFNFPTFLAIDFTIKQNFAIYGRPTKMTPAGALPESSILEPNNNINLSPVSRQDIDVILNDLYLEWVKKDYRSVQETNSRHGRKYRNMTYYIFDMDHKSVTEDYINAKVNNYIQVDKKNPRLLTCLLHSVCRYQKCYDRNQIRLHLSKHFFYVQCPKCAKKCNDPAFFPIHFTRTHIAQRRP